jgi:hypothetical protein
MTSQKLRLGILLDDYEIPAWLYTSIGRLVDSGYSDISLVILNENKDIYSSRFDRFWRNRRKILYYIFNRIDEAVFIREPNAFKTKNIGDILSDVPAIKIEPIQKKYSDYFQPSDVERLESYGLDILIKIGFRILKGGILTASRYGIWSYHHGDNRINRGGPPGFWEVVENQPETGYVLQILTEDLDGGKVICRSCSTTYALSPARNRNYYYWTSSSFLPRQIERLHRLGEERFFAEIQGHSRQFDFYDRKLYKTPSNAQALRLFARLMGRIIARAYQKVFYIDQWHLMFSLKKGVSTSFHRFKSIAPPKDRFWADPHVIRTNDNYYIFIEEYIYKTSKAHISVIEMDKRGDYKPPVQVIDRNYHLSYPFVFKWEGMYYMVPETSQNKTIELYECVEFPYRWAFKMNLMENMRACDATLFHYDGKWWLFAGIAENEGCSYDNELFLFFSDELLTNEWKPHPRNPILSDVRRARPAGRVFEKDGKIFRPSQNCSRTYGYGFNINEVLTLSETEYAEKVVASVTPEWNKQVCATHTFAYEGDLTIIDALMKRKRLFGSWAWEMARHVGRSWRSGSGQAKREPPAEAGAFARGAGADG